MLELVAKATARLMSLKRHVPLPLAQIVGWGPVSL